MCQLLVLLVISATICVDMPDIDSISPGLATCFILLTPRAGFPSVGKSSLLNEMTDTESLAAGYEFTTLTCIPGNIYYNDTRIQLLDLPGIIEGAAYGRGRGREVIAVARSSDLIVMVLDGAKEGGTNRHREILEKELETVGLRLNKVSLCLVRAFWNTRHHAAEFS